MVGRVLCSATLWCQIGWVGVMGFAYADDLDRAEPYRAEVNETLDVLKASQAAPSQACVSALEEVQSTDRQLQELTGQLDEGGEAPQALEGEQNEVGIARDVLATDLQAAVMACRSDIEHICVSTSSVAVAKPCDTFAHHMASAKPTRP